MNKNTNLRNKLISRRNNRAFRYAYKFFTNAIIKLLSVDTSKRQPLEDLNTEKFERATYDNNHYSYPIA